MGRSRHFNAVDVDEILADFSYDAELVPRDCDELLKAPQRADRVVDGSRISVIQAQPRLKTWLSYDEQSMLLIHTDEDDPRSLDLSYVCARMYDQILRVSKYAANSGSPVKVIALAFFCSRHPDPRLSAEATPSELVVSLILQLIDHYRDFDPEVLAEAMENLDPRDVYSSLGVFEVLVRALPQGAMVYLIIEGIRFFTQSHGRRPQDMRRRREMVDVVDTLAALYYEEPRVSAQLKLLFANPTRPANEILDLFSTMEILRIPKDAVPRGGYSTREYDRPDDLSIASLEI